MTSASSLLIIIPLFSIICCLAHDAASSFPSLCALPEKSLRAPPSRRFKSMPIDCVIYVEDCHFKGHLDILGPNMPFFFGAHNFEQQKAVTPPPPQNEPVFVSNLSYVSAAVFAGLFRASYDEYAELDDLWSSSYNNMIQVIEAVDYLQFSEVPLRLLSRASTQTVLDLSLSDLRIWSEPALAVLEVLDADTNMFFRRPLRQLLFGLDREQMQNLLDRQPNLVQFVPEARNTVSEWCSVMQRDDDHCATNLLSADQADQNTALSLIPAGFLGNWFTVVNRPSVRLPHLEGSFADLPKMSTIQSEVLNADRLMFTGRMLSEVDHRLEVVLRNEVLIKSGENSTKTGRGRNAKRRRQRRVDTTKAALVCFIELKEGQLVIDVNGEQNHIHVETTGSSRYSGLRYPIEFAFSDHGDAVRAIVCVREDRDENIACAQLHHMLPQEEAQPRQQRHVSLRTPQSNHKSVRVENVQIFSI